LGSPTALFIVPRLQQEWTQAGVFQALWAQGLLDYDELKGLDWQWQAMDGAMIKAPLGKEQTGPNPTARAKRGVRRSLLVDGYGLPLDLAVEGANRNDFKLVRTTLESIPVARPEPTRERRQNLCLEKGYDYDVRPGIGQGIWLHPAYSGQQ
jgi:putative transposase